LHNYPVLIAQTGAGLPIILQYEDTHLYVSTTSCLVLNYTLWVYIYSHGTRLVSSREPRGDPAENPAEHPEKNLESARTARPKRMPPTATTTAMYH